MKKDNTAEKENLIELTEEKVRELAKEEIIKYMGERAKRHFKLMED